MKTKDKNTEYAAATEAVDLAIKAHGLKAVRWVLNKRAEEERLNRELKRETDRLTERINYVKAKLKKMP